VNRNGLLHTVFFPNPPTATEALTPTPDPWNLHPQCYSFPMSAPASDPARPVYEALERLGIQYDVHEHPPVFTVEEALAHWAGIEATHCKNLFLRNKKGTRHYLVVAEHSKPVRLDALVAHLGDDRLSFGSPDRLQRYLGLTPGSVSPFGILNDANKEVLVVVDSDLRGAARVGFHPNVNTATVVIRGQDFERFLEASGNVVKYVKL
jgi:Ala-tRNA(Pro) deacylase